MDAPDEDLGRGSGVGECALVSGLTEKSCRVVARRRGVGEHGGEGGPVTVTQDSVGVEEHSERGAVITGGLADGLAVAGFEVYRPQGTYFITTDIAGLGGKDALAFCRSLPERCGVVAVPNSVFYDDPDAGRTQVRFAFCKKDDVLAEATTRLRKAFTG